jgi:hypothetical protein
VNRIKNLWSNDETIMDWVFHNKIPIVLLFSFGCFFVTYIYVKSWIKEYKEGIKEGKDEYR